MATVALWVKVDGKEITHALREAAEKLDGTEADVLLDFSAVRRIDPSAIRAMEELADTADAKAVKIGLHGVNVTVYKVLKLAKLAPRFSFTWDARPQATE